MNNSQANINLEDDVVTGIYYTIPDFKAIRNNAAKSIYSFADYLENFSENLSAEITYPANKTLLDQIFLTFKIKAQEDYLSNIPYYVKLLKALSYSVENSDTSQEVMFAFLTNSDEIIGIRVDPENMQSKVIKISLGRSSSFGEKVEKLAQILKVWEKDTGAYIMWEVVKLVNNIKFEEENGNLPL